MNRSTNNTTSWLLLLVVASSLLCGGIQAQQQQQQQQPGITKEMYEALIRELSQECRAELLDLQQRSARGEESDQENISGNCRVEIATVLSQFQGKEGAKAEEQGAAGQAQDDPPNNFVHPTYVLLGTVLAGLAAVSYIVYQKYEELQQKTPEERKREEKRLRKREKKGKVVNTE